MGAEVGAEVAGAVAQLRMVLEFTTTSEGPSVPEYTEDPTVKLSVSAVLKAVTVRMPSRLVLMVQSLAAGYTAGKLGLSTQFPAGEIMQSPDNTENMPTPVED